MGILCLVHVFYDSHELQSESLVSMDSNWASDCGITGIHHQYIRDRVLPLSL